MGGLRPVQVGRSRFQWVLRPINRSLGLHDVNQEPELTRSHPHSAMFLALPFPTITELRLRGCHNLTVVAQGFINFAAHPQFE